MPPRVDQPAEQVVIGRARQKEQLTELLVASQDAKRAGVLLGAAGAGKTTLLRWAHERAIEAGMATSFVRVPASAGLPPRFPIGELFDGLGKSCARLGKEVPEPLRRVLDTLRGQTTAEEYPAALPQLAQALESVAEHAPVALFLDDYQWAPADATELLFASIRWSGMPIFVLVTCRELPSHSASAALDANGDLWVDRIEVADMTPPDIADLATLFLGQPPLPSLTNALVGRAGGNPLHIVETLRFWRKTGSISSIAGHYGLDRGPIEAHRTVEALMVRRVRELDAGDLFILQLVALMARDVTYEELTLASAVAKDDLLARVERLLAAGVLSETVSLPPSYRVSHPLLEQAVSSTVSMTRAAQLHELIYLGLKSLGREHAPAELAHHALASLTRPPDITVLVERAAEEAHTAGASQDAASWYDRLAFLQAQAGLPNEGSLLRQAEATLNFDPRGAVRILTPLVGDRETEHYVDALALRSAAFRVQGDFQAAFDDVQTALQATRRRDFGLEHSLSILYALTNRLDEAELQISAAGSATKTPHDHARWLGARGSFAFCKSDLHSAHSLWGEALDGCTDSTYRIQLLHNLAWVKVLLGHWAEASSLMDAGARDAHRSGDVWNLTSLLAARARLRAWQGDLSDALDDATTAVALADHIENKVCSTDAFDALGVVLLESGEAAEALAALTRALRDSTHAPEMRELSFTYAAASQAATLVGDCRLAREMIESARVHLPEARFWEVYVDRAEIGLITREGRSKTPHHLVEKWQDYDLMPFERAALLEAAGELARRAGDLARAREAFQTSHSLFESLGARRHAEALSARLAMVRPRPRGRPKSSLSHGLTPRELEVMALVAQGFTNREIAERLFLSPATVKSHVERLIRKTSRRTRTDLAALAASLGLAGD